MKKIAIVLCFLLVAIVSHGQTQTQEPKTKIDPPKKETVKAVPKSTQRKAQVKKAQIKNAQMQNKKKKQVVRKAQAIRRKRNR